MVIIPLKIKLNESIIQHEDGSLPYISWDCKMHGIFIVYVKH